jgi:hypothetical protein
MDIYIARGEERNGPYPADSIRQFLADGELDGTELAWHEGLDEWVNVRDVIKETPLSPVFCEFEDGSVVRVNSPAFREFFKAKRAELENNLEARKFQRPAWIIMFGGFIYSFITKANHFGYPWYGWPLNYISYSESLAYSYSGDKEPIIAGAIMLVGGGLYLWPKWKNYID